jgi:phage shock protein C
MNRRLYRCRHDRRLAGVAAGVAEFLDLDPTLVRVLWFVSAFFGGISIVLYIGLALIVPLEPLSDVPGGDATAGGAEGGPDVAGPDVAGPNATATPEGHRHRKTPGTGRLTTFVGIVLVFFGALALLNVLLPDWAHSWRYLWPVFILGIGALLIAGGLRREPSDPGEVR